jgi:hypothetical protein
MDNEEFIEEMEWLLIEQQMLLISLKLININQKIEIYLHNQNK